MEGMIGNMVSACMRPVEEVLAKTGLTADDISKVCLEKLCKRFK